MRRLVAGLRVAATAAVIAATLFAAGTARAQIVRSFTPRFSTNDHGDVTLIGNTLMSCSGNGNACKQGRLGAGGSINDDDFAMAYVDIDADGTTFCSSNATLALPVGATVLWAGLYWQGDSNNGARNQVKFSTPVAAYTAMTATQLDVTGTAYQGFIDVTARVQAGGNGAYTVANVQSTTGATYFAGWALAVAYRLASNPSRNLVVEDGYAQVAAGATVTIPVSGFLTPPGGIVNTRLGVVTGEGDLGLTGDAFQINGTTLSDAANPADNFFNSSISQFGVNVTTKNPNYVNQLGWDVDMVSANGVLPNGATSATITLTSASDRYYPSVVTFATDLYQPVYTGNGFFKSVADLNGGSVRPGDVLEYTVRMNNSGDDASTNTVVRDTLPANVTYVAGSLSVVNGPNTGAKTDAIGDDVMEYDPATRIVTARLGTGATGTLGGRVDPDVQTTVKFRAAVNLPLANGSVVSNQALANFNAAQLGTALSAASDADTLTAGNQRTNVTVVAQTLSGTVFEDVNYGGGAGRTKAASAGVARPGARVELYGAAGQYLAADTTDVNGLYSFDGIGPGSLTVRVVSSMVTSSRPGAVAGLLPVQTFRVDASSGAAVNDAVRVGGEVPSKVDAGMNTTNATLASLTTAGATAQSIAPVTTGTVNFTGVDFGFNFDVIVNANDSGQGSLRQFLTNANALQNTGLAQSGLTGGIETSIFMVSDGAAHAGLRTGLASLLTGGVVAIAPITTLPAITDPARLDGTTQTTNVGNTNAGTLNSTIAVGADGLTVTALARPEVEIKDGASLALGVDVQASGVTLTGLAIYGFGNTPANDAHANVRIGATAGTAVIDGCAIGVSASSFADPGAAARSGGDAVRVIGGDDGILRNSIVAYAAGNGVALATNSDRWTLTGNEIRGNAIGNASRDAVSLEASASDVVRGNRIADTEGCGIDARTSTGSGTFENNTISRSGLGAAGTPETPGVRLGGTANRVDRNVLFDNYGAGVLVMSSSSANTITKNSMYNNGGITNNAAAAATGQLGIDLESATDDVNRGTAPYVTLDDLADADAGGNGLLNFPVLESAVLAGGNLTLTGWARPGSVIELFVSDSDPSGFGEGKTWLTTLTEGSVSDLDASSSTFSGTINGLVQGTDNTNRFRFTFAAPGGVAGGVRLTATATLSQATSEFSGQVTVAGGVSVAGYGYLDVNHSLNRDAAEAGTGATLYAKLVASSTPGSAQAVVAIDAVTGAYAFSYVTAGTYTIVLDDNNAASDVAPAYPVGMIGTEVSNGARPLTVANANLADQDFGMWRGSRADGIVFRDDGAGGGTANDGVNQAGEGAVGGVRVALANAACAGGRCDSTLTDGAGAFTLWIPNGAVGTSTQALETNPSGWVSTGGGAGTTGGAYSRNSDMVTFTPAGGVAYSGLRFGDVPPNTFAPNGNRSGTPGAAVFHPHTFIAGSGGSVSFTAVESPSPAIPGWTAELYRDLNCNGSVDAGDNPVTAPVVVTAGQTLCLVLKHFIPGGAPAGASEQVTLGASMSYTNASPALVTVVSLGDRTTVISAGSLEIVKTVDLASARPGDVLTYTITYRNLGPAPLSAILLQDATPAYTVFQSASCGAAGNGITACNVTAQPAVNASGPVRWTLTGALTPGGAGAVTFQVKVQ